MAVKMQDKLKMLLEAPSSMENEVKKEHSILHSILSKVRNCSLTLYYLTYGIMLKFHSYALVLKALLTFTFRVFCGKFNPRI